MKRPALTFLLLPFLLVASATSCRGPDSPPEQPPVPDAPPIPAPEVKNAPADGTAGGGSDVGQDTGGAAANLPEGVTPALIEQGRKLYSGLGRCQACHGFGGRGSTQGPPLNGKAPWLHTDGSYESLVEVIRTGVPKPKRYMIAMPPAGGAPLTDEHIRAVAAYTWSISQPAR